MDNFCPNCGKPLEPNSKFCPYCGQRLENELSINSGDSDVKLKSRQGIKKKRNHYFISPIIYSWCWGSRLLYLS